MPYEVYNRLRYLNCRTLEPSVIFWANLNKNVMRKAGDYEGDVIIGRKFASGIYASAGYGIDNDIRQVGFVQITLNF